MKASRTRWERIRLLPFTRKKTPHERDVENLETERSVKSVANNLNNSSKVDKEKCRNSDLSAIDSHILTEEQNASKGYLHLLAREGNEEHVHNYLTQLVDDATIVQNSNEEDEEEPDKSDIDSVKRKLNERDEEDLTALHYAVRYSHFEVVKLLVDHGADVNAGDANGATPLHAAARGRKMTTKMDDMYIAKHFVDEPNLNVMRFADETARAQDGGGIQHSMSESELTVKRIVECLTSNNADVNAKDRFGLTPLHYAALRGNYSAALALLGCPKVNVDAVDNQKQTPLHTACCYKWVKMCELLIKNNATVNAKDNRNCTPLHLASAEGNLNVIELLLKTAELRGGSELRLEFVNERNFDWDTPLFIAITNGHEKVVKHFIEQGADIAAKHKKLNRSLHIASMRGFVSIMKLLIENGAKVQWHNIDRETSLHLACAYNRAAAVELLLSYGVDIEARDKFSRTPFLVCVQNSPSDENLKIIKFLMEHGANINTPDKVDKSAAILAAKANNVPALEALLMSDKSEQLAYRIDRKSNTPMHIAAKAGFVNAIKCLASLGSPIDGKNEDELTPLHLAAKYGHIDAVSFILSIDQADTIRDEDENGDTPLHLAAGNNHEQVIQLLLDYSPDLIGARNSRRLTPLDIAAGKGCRNAVDVLLNNGANVGATDRANTTALHEACKEGKLEIVKLLLSKGATPDTLDYKFRNCLDLALDNDHKDVAKVIVNHERWSDVMKHCRTDIPNAKHRTPLRELIEKQPDIAREVLNHCVVTNNKPSDHIDYKITYNYEFIDDVYSSWEKEAEQNANLKAMSPRSRLKHKAKDFLNGFDDKGRLKRTAQLYSVDKTEIRNNHPLMLMVHAEKEELLGHELVTSLLNYKWNLYGKFIYYGGLLLYVMFVAFLTDYAISGQPPYNYPEGFFDLPSDYCTLENFTSVLLDIPAVKTHSRFSQYATLIFAFANITKEVLQLLFRRQRYVFDIHNAIEISLYVCSFLFVVDWTDCSRIDGHRLPKQWEIGVVAASLAWINFVLMIRKFPHIGIYVVMFTDVLRTFSKFFVVFFLFVVAFALAFYMLFQNQHPYATFPITIVKTLVMMVGEFEYNAMFYTGTVEHTERAYYAKASQVVFFIFVIFMTIIIMNLLVGLAVDDIKTVQSKAVLKRLAMQVELVLEIEYIAPEFLRRKWIIGHQTMYPNQRHSIFNKLFYMIWPKNKDELPQNVVDSLYGERIREDEIDDGLNRAYENMMSKMMQLSQNVKEVQQQQKELADMLKAVMIRFDVSIDQHPQPQIIKIEAKPTVPLEDENTKEEKDN